LLTVILALGISYACFVSFSPETVSNIRPVQVPALPFLPFAPSSFAVGGKWQKRQGRHLTVFGTSDRCGVGAISRRVSGVSESLDHFDVAMVCHSIGCSWGADKTAL
jgi:hypothetical protein